jgi:Tfp pilus assembly protein PilF
MKMKVNHLRVLILVLLLSAAVSQASSDVSAEAKGAAVPGAQPTEQYRANRFFRAIGRLFGGGGKKEKSEARRKDERAQRQQTGVDPKQFESAVGARVTDATTRPQPAPEPAPAADAAAETAAGLLARGRGQLADARVNEAVASFSRAVSLEPNSAEGHGLLGVAYDMKGMPRTAAESYERALRLAPGDAEVLNNYGFFLYRQGEYKEAKDVLKRAAKAAPSDPQVWNNLALTQCRLGKFDDALKSFARAGGEFKGRMNVANQLERAGRDKDALKHYEEARRLNPTSRAVHQHLADVYQRLGMEREAEAARETLSAPKKDAAKAVNGGGR